MDDHPSTDRAYDTRGNPPPPGASPGRRVLVIEDLADARDSLRVLLEAALDVEVDVAADGTEGLEMIARRPYAVVLTDLRMPRVGGMKVLEAVRARNLPTPVIITTAHGDAPLVDEAMRKGAADYLTKPFDTTRLCNRVRAALESAGPGGASPAGPPARPGPEAAEDEAFSALTVVTRYPVPVAVAYRRFCQEQDPVSRMTALTRAVEATLRYLSVVALSDLFHCLAASPGGDRGLPEHPAFDCLRRRRPMTLGVWLDALREAARALAGEPGRFVRPLPEVCGPGGALDRELLAPLVESRNRFVHEAGLTAEECREALDDARPRLERALHRLGFLSQYPLGFARRSPGGGMARGRARYGLHGCMGTRVADTAEAYVIETTARLEEQTPFLVGPDGTGLLYLWPLLRARELPRSGQHSLVLFDGVPGRRGFLTEVRYAAVDSRKEWREVLHADPAADHRWLFDRLRALPPVVALPAGLNVAGKIRPASGRLVGRELGGYRLGQVIGCGGFGTVYLAERTGRGAPVAVKVIEAPDGARNFVRFQREYERLEKAQAHPGVVRVYDSGSEVIDGREFPWYAMEFAPGGDLSGRLRERRDRLGGRPPWSDPATRSQVCAEFRAVAEAVAHLHRLGIVHRDIKPGNVLIVGDGQLRLSDFGLVKPLDRESAGLTSWSSTSTGAVLGTRHYMAPEQERGRTIRPAADVYALGVLLAELAAGVRPAADRPLPSSGSPLQPATALAALPEPLARFIARCTDVRPGRRPADAGAVLGEFDALLA